MTPRTLALALSLSLAAAAVPFAAHGDDWRRARVRSIGPRAQVDPAVNVDCAPPRPAQPDAPVLVLSFRVGKSQQWRAVNLSPDDAFAVGEDVRVDLSGCSLRRLDGPAARAASAP
jgi:hypothetical protein